MLINQYSGGYDTLISSGVAKETTHLSPYFPPLPSELMLSAYPNPFYSATTVISSANSRITIFDLKGNTITTQEVCSGTFEWKPSESMPSGLYLIRAELDGKTKTINTLYLK